MVSVTYQRHIHPLKQIFTCILHTIRVQVIEHNTCHLRQRQVHSHVQIVNVVIEAQVDGRGGAIRVNLAAATDNGREHIVGIAVHLRSHVDVAECRLDLCKLVRAGDVRLHRPDLHVRPSTIHAVKGDGDIRKWVLIRVLQAVLVKVIEYRPTEAGLRAWGKRGPTTD